MKKCEDCGADNSVLQSDEWETTTNFCRECGNKLREKCSECGQMERIGRPFCEQEARKIRNQLISIAREPGTVIINGVELFVLLLLYIVPTAFFLADVENYWKTHKIFCMLVGAVIFCAWCFMSDLISYLKRYREEKINESKRAFLEANPDMKRKHELWWNWINS